MWNVCAKYLPHTGRHLSFASTIWFWACAADRSPAASSWNYHDLDDDHLNGGFGDDQDQCRESFLFSPAAVEWHLLSESGMENLIVIKIISPKIGHLIILSSFSVWWRHYWGFIDQEPIHTSTYQLRQNIFFHIISPSSQHCSSVSNSWESTTRNISRHLWGSWTASLMWHIWAVFVIKRPLKYRKNPKIRSVSGLHYIVKKLF